MAKNKELDIPLPSLDELFSTQEQREDNSREKIIVEKQGGVNDIIQVDETETISIAGGDLYEEKNVVNIM